ncbi:MAG: dihydrofolate reductase [Bacteroidetes bacterium HGW-Bacteroidetes-21]|jgi:dihydrofolate reductase|nr:MAG: dihydrofolate reductase [Bacteroidetes bacterium HGW-Bacteroidetes-21]
MTFSIIVAIANNRGIGKNNQLLFHLPEDLKYFKRITSGHPVIMGKNTWDSLPIKPLPGRTNIVLNREMNLLPCQCEVLASVDEVKQYCETLGNEECFIIGGGEVYKTFLPLADKLYITRVEKEFEADTFFPEFNNDQWKLTSSEENFSEKEGFKYFFELWKRQS